MKTMLPSLLKLLLILLAVQHDKSYSNCTGTTESCSITEAGPPAECYGRLGEPVYIKVMTNTEVRGLELKFEEDPNHKCKLINGWSTSGSHKNFCHFTRSGTIQLDHLSKSHSGHYSFYVFNINGTSILRASMSLTIQEPVSPPLVSQLCLCTGAIKVSCSSTEDHPEYSWTLDYLPLNGTKVLFGDETQTVILKEVSGSITCTVSNRVSKNETTQELLKCTGTTESCSITEAGPPAECYGRLGEPVYIKVMTNTEVRGLELKFEEDPNHKCKLINGWSTSGSHKNFCHFTRSGTIQLDHLSKSHSGHYSFYVFNINGTSILRASMSLTIQEPVSPPLVSQLCLCTGAIKVSCSSTEDHPEYSWTLDYLPLNGKKVLFGDETQTVILKKGVSGLITCTVSNRVSKNETTQELLKCPGTTESCSITEAEPPAECYGRLGEPVYIKVMTNTEVRGLDFKFKESPLRKCKLINGRSTSGSHKNFCHFTRSGTIQLYHLSKSHSSHYSFYAFNINGTSILRASMSLTIQEPVSPPLVSQLCLSTGEITVSCSSTGDHPEYIWTLDYRSLNETQALLSDETQTVILKKGVSGSITCTVSNRVSKNETTQELFKCPGSDDKLRLMEFCLA